VLGGKVPGMNVVKSLFGHVDPRGRAVRDMQTICNDAAAVLAELVSSSEDEMELAVSDYDDK
jgi:hypothetical protein